MKHRLQTLLKHKLQWLVLLTALLGTYQNAQAWDMSSSSGTLYYDNTNSEWSTCYFMVGNDGSASRFTMSRVSGTQYLWKFTANSSWNGANGWRITKQSSGYTDGIYKACWGSDYESTTVWASAYTNNKIYIAGGTTCRKTSNCSECKEHYDLSSQTYATYAVTISNGSGGSVSVKDYDNTTVSSGNTKCYLTVLKVTVTPNSGYEISSVSIGGTDYTDAAKSGTVNYTMKAATTITVTYQASCTRPTAYSLALKTGSPSNICADGDYGTASTTLRLANSQTGYSYQLYNSSDTPIGSAQTGTTGSALDFSVSAGGTYHMVGYLTGTPSCSTTMTNTPSVTQYSVPTYSSITAGARVCQGANKTLTISSPGGTYAYQWKKGGNNVGTNSASYTISGMTSAMAATYTCVITNTACTKTTDGIVITYAPAPSGTTISGSTPVCASTTGLTYSASSTTVAGSTYSYAWSITSGGGTGWNITGGATTSEATVTAGTGNGTVAVTPTLTTSGTACAGSQVTKSVTVNALPTISLTGTGAVDATHTYPWEWMTVTATTSPSDLTVTWSTSFAGPSGSLEKSMEEIGTPNHTYRVKSNRSLSADQHTMTIDVTGNVTDDATGCSNSAKHRFYNNQVPAETCN